METLESNICREAQKIILIDHPNVLKAHCSFVNDHNLWVVMPYMAGGSCLHITKSVYPDGFEEVVIATILCEVLKGLEYLHHHRRIHRDVKIKGTIQASPDRSDWEGKNPLHWILFNGVNNLHVTGGGTINGNGEIWWRNSCKINKYSTHAMSW